MSQVKIVLYKCYKYCSKLRTETDANWHAWRIKMRPIITPVLFKKRRQYEKWKQKSKTTVVRGLNVLKHVARKTLFLYLL